VRGRQTAPPVGARDPRESVLSNWDGSTEAGARGSGGDEFACVITGLNTADATKRLNLVNAALAEAAEPASVTIGVTGLQPTDSTQDLLARADAALYRERSESGRNSP
jgi:GGDEF domain-containing protein